MDDELFFKFCHDIISPINALSLILESNSLDNNDTKLANLCMQKLIYIIENYKNLFKQFSNEKTEIEKKTELISKLFETKNIKIINFYSGINDINLIKIIHILLLIIYEKSSNSGKIEFSKNEEGISILFNTEKINFNDDFGNFITDFSKNFPHSKNSSEAFYFFISKILKENQYKIITQKNKNEIRFFIKKT